MIVVDRNTRDIDSDVFFGLPASLRACPAGRGRHGRAAGLRPRTGTERLRQGPTALLRPDLPGDGHRPGQPGRIATALVHGGDPPDHIEDGDKEGVGRPTLRSSTTSRGCRDRNHGRKPVPNLPAVHDVLAADAAALADGTLTIASSPPSAPNWPNCVNSSPRASRRPIRRRLRRRAPPNGWSASPAEAASGHQRDRRRAAHQPRPRPDGGGGGAGRLRRRPRLSQPGTGPGHRQALVAAERRARMGLPADRRGVGHGGQQLRRRDGDRAAGRGGGQGGDRLARPADRDRRQFPHPRDHGGQRRRAARGRHDQHHPPGRLRTRPRPEHRRPDARPHQQLPRIRLHEVGFSGGPGRAGQEARRRR